MALEGFLHFHVEAKIPAEVAGGSEIPCLKDKHPASRQHPVLCGTDDNGVRQGGGSLVLPSQGAAAAAPP